MSNCNCPEEYQAIEWQAGDNLSSIAARATIPEHHMEILVDNVNGDPIYINPEECFQDFLPSEGSIICVKGPSPLLYDAFEESEPSTLDAVALTEILTLIDYVEALGIAAQATPDTIDNAGVEHFFEEYSHFPSQLAYDIVNLKCQFGYYEEESSSILNMILSYQMGDCSTIAIDPTINDFGREFLQQMIDLRHQMIMWVERIYGTRVDNLLPLVADKNLFNYDAALEYDEDFPALLENLRPILAAWKDVKSREKANLTSLAEKIALMRPNDILVNVWVGNIIDTFDRFRSHMQTRHDLFQTLYDMMDRIDLLQMTPEQRLERARKRDIITWFERHGLEHSLTEDMDWESEFKPTVLQILNYGLHGENDASNLNLNALNENPLVVDTYGLFAPTFAQEALSEHPNFFSTNYSQFTLTLFNTRMANVVDELEQERRNQIIQTSADVAFFAIGFFPVIGDILDITDFITALASGNATMIAMSAVGLMPFDELLTGVGKGMRRLADIAEDLLRRSDKIIQRLLDELGMTLDEIWEWVSGARRRADEIDEMVLHAETGNPHNNSSNPPNNSGSSGQGSSASGAGRPPENSRGNPRNITNTDRILFERRVREFIENSGEDFTQSEINTYMSIYESLAREGWTDEEIINSIQVYRIWVGTSSAWDVRSVTHIRIIQEPQIAYIYAQNKKLITPSGTLISLPSGLRDNEVIDYLRTNGYFNDRYGIDRYEEMLPRLNEADEALNAANRSPNIRPPRVIYRGMYVGVNIPENATLTDIEVMVSETLFGDNLGLQGRSYTEGAWSSYTEDSDIALDFAYPDNSQIGIIFEINDNTRAVPIHPGEGEVLTPRNSQYLITSVEWDDTENILVIHMRETNE